LNLSLAVVGVMLQMLNDDINRFLGVLSYPFVSLDCLHHDLLQEYLQKERPTIKDKKQIRNKVVQHIHKCYSIYSYDELYLYLDKWYLYPKTERLSPQSTFGVVFGHLENLSQSLISQRDGKIVYKYWENENDNDFLGGFAGTNKIYLFHSMNRLFPLDILCIIFMLKNNKEQSDLDGFYGNVQVSDTLLDRVLEQGVAENHLHSGVSCSFLNLWDDLMKPLNPKQISALDKFDLENIHSMKTTELKYYLWLASVLRMEIAVELKRDKISSHQDDICTPESRELKRLFSTPKGIKKNYRSLCSEEQEDENKLGDLPDYFIKLWNGLLESCSAELIQKNGLMYTVFDVPNTLRTSDENLFLFETLNIILKESTLKEESSKNKMLSIFFINYLRIKNIFYNLLVQQKTIKGLDYFQLQCYRNNSVANQSAVAMSRTEFWERAIREQLQNQNLQKLELRASINNNETVFKNGVRGFLKAYRRILKKSYYRWDIDQNGEKIFTPRKPFPKVGLVLHLTKQEQSHFPEKCIFTGENDLQYLQFGVLHDSYQEQLNILRKFRQEYKGLDKYLVGLDVASLENAVPTWVLTSIYEHARDSNIDLLRSDHNNREQYQSLGFTIHAGEDYRHILSGLRRIDESVRYLKFHAGDRIGHGIALGISPDVWYQSNATIIIPRIEALENYLWAYNIFSQNHNESTLVNLAYLEKKIYEFAKEIYSNTKGLTTNVLVDGYIELFRTDMFENWDKLKCENCGESEDNQDNIPDLCKYSSDTNRRSFTWDVKSLLFARHCKIYIRKMNEPIHYKVTEQDIAIAREAQRIVKQYLNKQGIVVEINPSSNVAIGDMDTLSENQIYSINHCTYELDNIIACINSDDPSVFNTNVSNELAYIYFGMIEKDVSRETILLWIDKLRKNGLTSSFIRQTETDGKILEELDRLLEEM